MSFIEKIFGKSAEKLSLTDIRNFFSTPQEESSVLEFKSGDVEINSIFSEITAFLNTEGGLLIIGAPKEKAQEIGKNKIKMCHGDLVLSKYKNKDSLYQKICSNIVPSPINLSITEFLTSEGNVFIIDIPQSMTPPHQCSTDGKYYLRLEREAKFAPHGIIEALFNKRRVPNLVSDIEIDNEDIESHKINIKIRNISSVPAENVSVMTTVFNVDGISSNMEFNTTYESNIKKETSIQNISNILAQIIHTEFDLEVYHGNKIYAIVVAYWAKDFDTKFRYYYSSATEVIEQGDNETNPNFYDFYNLLTKEDTER